MLKKFTTTQLLILLVVLGGLVAVVKMSSSFKSERTFRDVLVQIDSSKVTEIYIVPKKKAGEEKPDVKLYKEGPTWRVDLPTGKTAVVGTDQIAGMIDQLESIKPKRLASKKEEKWTDYEVTGETATHLKVKEGGETTLDMYIGKFSFQQQPQSMTTYVRLEGDIETYAVDGFLDATFNRDANSFRDKQIVKDDWKNWTSVSCISPTTGMYELSKDGTGNWLLNGAPADSTKVTRTLTQMGNLFGGEFVDGFQPSGGGAYELNIESSSAGTITVKGYALDSANVVLHSSLNPDGYFDGKGGLTDRVFVGPDKFMNLELAPEL